MFELHEYQAEAVEKLVKSIRRALDDHDEDQTLSAVGLVAPTAAGKTVMAAALLERLFDGDATHGSDPNLVVVWFSDQPALNKQSMDKIETARPTLNHKRLVNLADFDERVLTPGKVYFSHAQQYGKGATSFHALIMDRGEAKTNDARDFGVWDMIANTVADESVRFLLIVDEAHRGVGTESNQSVRKTILATLIHGGPRGIGGDQPPAPVVLGISATAARFEESIARAGQVNDAPRDTKIIPTDILKVRASGLLKDYLDIPKPLETQESNQTLVAQGVEKLKEVTERWDLYREQTGAPRVLPALVVQVKPAVPNTEILEILRTLETAWPLLKEGAIAHSFDSHMDLMAGSGSSKRTVRYLAPNDIQEDETARVILFKTALTTGWDCPRAEVMVSMRGSADPTTIAQLIGRMVRTPLAKRIEDGDTELNSVYLALPHYDRKEVAQVVTALKADSDTAEGAKIYSVPLIPNPAVPDEVRTLLWSIPAAHRLAPRFKSITARAVALAAELAAAPFNLNAKEILDARLLGRMATEYHAGQSEIDLAVNEVMHLNIVTDRYADRGVRYELETEGRPERVDIVEADLDRAYKRATNVFPEDVGINYTTRIVDVDGLDYLDAQARLIAMSRMTSVVVRIEKDADDQITQWRSSYTSAVNALPDSGRRTRIVSLWLPPGTTMATDVINAPKHPTAATVTTVKEKGISELVALPEVAKHVYSTDSNGMYPIKYGSTWEEQLLKKVLKSETLVGWYRNPSSGGSALSVQYDYGDESGLMHPDFLFFHETDVGLRVDIIDPHQHSNADTGSKWRGLSTYANQIGKEHAWLRNVYGVIRSKDAEGNEGLRAIDLRDATISAALGDVNTKPQVEGIFAIHGFAI